MNDAQHILASAYLDGALTDEERAQAEADPEVMAAVERLGEVRRALAAVEPPDRARRDAAINAALGVFDSESRVAAPPPVTSIAARRSDPLADAGRRRGRRGGPRRRAPGHARRRRRQRWRRRRRCAATAESGVLLEAAERPVRGRHRAAATGDTRSADEGEVAAATTAAGATEAAGTLAAAHRYHRRAGDHDDGKRSS